jgi:hypothetical protein
VAVPSANSGANLDAVSPLISFGLKVLVGGQITADVESQNILKVESTKDKYVEG